MAKQSGGLGIWWPGIILLLLVLAWPRAVDLLAEIRDFGDKSSYRDPASAYVEGAVPVNFRLHRWAVAQFREDGTAPEVPKRLIYSVGLFEAGNGSVLARKWISDSAMLTDFRRHVSFNIFLPGPLAPGGRRVQFENGVGKNGELLYWTTGIGMSGAGCIGYARAGTMIVRRSSEDRIAAEYDVVIDYPTGGWTSPDTNCRANAMDSEQEFPRAERRTAGLDNPTGFSLDGWNAWRDRNSK